MTDTNQEATCFFCGKPADADAKLTKDVYKVTSRTIGVKVKYQKAAMDFPRCKDCLEIHNKGGSRVLLILFLAIVAGAGIGYFVQEHYITGGIIGAVVGWFVGSAAGRKKSKSYGIKDDGDDTLKTYPPMAAMAAEGWGFRQPTT